MPRVLVTGFEPFDGLSHNPSQAVLERLPARAHGVPLTTHVLPVDTGAIQARLHSVFQNEYDLVLLTGLARNRPALSVERYAFNQREFEHPDNQGQMMHDEVVLSAGPPRLDVRLEPQAIVDAWIAEGLPAETSDSPGRFLCNQTLYLALTMLPPSVRVGFIHLPPDEILAPNEPHLPLAKQAQALLTAIRVSLLAVVVPTS